MNKYFAKYKVEMSFDKICDYLKEFKVKYITKQASIKTIGFYSTPKEAEKIRKLENIIEIECYEGRK